MSLSFETIILNAASLGEFNPMPDLKNVSYIHVKFDTTPNVTDADKLHFGVYIATDSPEKRRLYTISSIIKIS